jgi:hypothetical protein
MWVVEGTTVAGKTVSYKVPAGKDTDKAFVMALAFQEHGKAAPDDALTAETTVTWASDNVVTLPDALVTSIRKNFAVDKRIARGVWERHSTRAYRTLESATDALESAASEYPSDKFRILVTTTTTEVVAISKNAFPAEVTEEPEAPKEDAPAEAPKESEAAKEAEAPKGRGRAKAAA